MTRRVIATPRNFVDSLMEIGVDALVYEKRMRVVIVTDKDNLKRIDELFDGNTPIGIDIRVKARRRWQRPIVGVSVRLFRERNWYKFWRKK